MGRRTVSEVAALTRVTVRTLHHYDEIGLLPPSDRTEAGYRLYDDAAVARLHTIVLWRSLGFPLDEIRALLDDPEHRPREALELHRQRLLAEVGELHARLRALDEVAARLDDEAPLSDADLVVLFDGFDPAAYEAEAEERWGHTEAWAESKRRTARYGPREWSTLQDEGRQLNERLASLLRAGTPPTATEARAAAEAHRQYMCRWFYDCTPEVHLGLADLYAADPRFAASYDKVAQGLSGYVVAAIRALHAPPDRRL